MLFRNRPACKRRSPEVYRNLSEQKTAKREPSEGYTLFDDLHLSWRQRIWFNMRSLYCCGKPGIK
ncbi:hypothetical protein M5D96_009661 [Drosophila gunungcola]|uniref:Uncharacterized protein n=1 Tax=Drosophila gunungcola TaxID=103775 RepID=A0A9P9YIA1_9MUSC|nr:hypothetical protein M5D96_009661 [Drosophila gunungcola]